MYNGYSNLYKCPLLFGNKILIMSIAISMNVYGNFFPLLDKIDLPSAFPVCAVMCSVRLIINMYLLQPDVVILKRQYVIIFVCM